MDQNNILFYMTKNYVIDFNFFLSHTNEKQVFLRELAKEIRDRDAHSILDIGAGNGELSVPLAKIVDQYLAIEPNDVFAGNLRKAGLSVVQQKFPTPINDLFDVVVISHSLSYEEDVYPVFLMEAWKLVKPKGCLILITYRAEEDDWTRLMRHIGQNITEGNITTYSKIVALLHSLGQLTIRKITTKVVGGNVDEIIDALSFVASDGEPYEKARFLQHKPALTCILNEQYSTDEQYAFPFTHFLMRVIKS